MKKNYVFMAAALFMLGSCSDESMNISLDDAVAEKAVAVTFGTYTGNSATTRAGATDPMTTEKMQTTGFGVFAYNTGADDYTVGGKTGQTPNFMYNQKVYGSTWTYNPVKYWPNLNNVTDNQSPAATEANDYAKLSFFAYAPYVETIPANDKNNIVELVANDAVVDPYVKYMFPADGKNVDLLWGTANSTDENVLGTAQGGTTLTISTNPEVKGLAPVNVNLTKQKTDGKIKFFFKHALSNIGGSSTITNSNIDNPNDDQNDKIDVKQGGFQAILDINNGSGKKASTTVVTIKNIQITGRNNAPANTEGEDESGDPVTVGANDDYVIVGGKLNLATGVWTKILKQQTVNDTEGIFNHNITSDASTQSEKNDSNATLSDKLAEPANITNSSQWNQLPIGVLTDEAQNVYKDETNPLVFMPGSKPHLVVTVEYIVRTKDDKLKDGWTQVVQKVTKAIDFPTIEMNKKYNLIMRIGMTDIKFDATVQDWTAYNPGQTTDPNGSNYVDPNDPNYNNNPANPNNTVNIDVYVPKNVETTPAP